MAYDIVRVWGTADSFDLEFKHNGGIEWQCSVPPDTSDGKYAVELYAMNRFGEYAHWVGELFMCNGVCHLKIYASKYLFWFKPHRLCFEPFQSKKLSIVKECVSYEH